MATLTLDKTWVNLVSTGAGVSGNMRGEMPSSFEMSGEVRTFAGGRQRSVASEGERGIFAFSLYGLTLATIDTLRLWKGQAVLVRDARGQYAYGVMYKVDVNPRAYDFNLYEVNLTLRVVTQVESV